MRKGPYSPERQLLRALLIETRQAAGLEQQELAARLGVPPSLISRLERGDRRLDVLELRAVCQALGVPLDQFLHEFEARLAREAL